MSGEASFAVPVTVEIAVAPSPSPRELEKDARLRRFILRVERLEEERAALLEDIRQVYAEAKGTGYETKYMRMIVRLRKMEPDQRDEQDHLVDLYRKACGIGRRGMSAPADGDRQPSNTDQDSVQQKEGGKDGDQE